MSESIQKSLSNLYHFPANKFIEYLLYARHPLGTRNTTVDEGEQILTLSEVRSQLDNYGIICAHKGRV